MSPKPPLVDQLRAAVENGTTVKLSTADAQTVLTALEATTNTREDLKFVLASLDAVQRAMEHGNLFASGAAFQDLRHTVQRKLEGR